MEMFGFGYRFRVVSGPKGWPNLLSALFALQACNNWVTLALR